MSDPDSVELSHGFPDPRTLIGKTIILRPRRDLGFPLVAGLVCGLLALGLLTAVALAFRIRSEWDPLQRTHAPQLTPAAISRISAPSS